MTQNRWAGAAQTVYFDTFEAREKAFNEAVGWLIPARYRGAAYFWRDMRDILAKGWVGDLPAYITSDPGDGLAYGSPLQVLAAARLGGGQPAAAEACDMASAAERFGLRHALTQPIRTLSGGETVRLALARVWMTVGRSRNLVVSSPFCWMSARHMPLLQQVIETYSGNGKTVRILAMRGEDAVGPMTGHWLRAAAIEPIGLQIHIRQLRMTLGVPINTLTAEPAAARVEDFSASIESPGLISGDNGQGKSLLAKAFARALPIQGQCRIGTADRLGRARLLFQDVVGQTLLRSLDHLARSSRSAVVADPRVLGRQLQDRAKRILTGAGRISDRISDQISDQTSDQISGQGLASMLAVKTLLIAVRLAARPAALILDEPDWGLARPVAIALVLAVVEAAHAMGVPVLLISHKPWWRSMVRSELAVSKKPADRTAERFVIVVRQKPCGWDWDAPSHANAP